MKNPHFYSRHLCTVTFLLSIFTLIIYSSFSHSTVTTTVHVIQQIDKNQPPQPTATPTTAPSPAPGEEYQESFHSDMSKDFSAFRNTCKYLPGEAGENEPNEICSFLESDYSYAKSGQWVKTCDNQIHDPIKFAYGFSMYEVQDKEHWDDRVPYYMSFGPLQRFQATKDRTNVLKYSWFPTKCKLLPYTRESMRRELGKRRLYVVGDSLSMELADSLDFLSGMSVHAYKTWTVLNHRTLAPATVEESKFCRCLENSLLMRGKMHKYEMQDKRKCWRREFSKVIDEKKWESYCPLPPPADDKTRLHESPSMWGWVEDFDKYDTFVFSLGHHSRKLGELETTYEKIVDNTAAWLENKIAHGWNGTIIYLAAPMGHRNCFNHTEPFVNFDPDLKWDSYGWRKTVRAQEVWKKRVAFSQLLKDRFAFLDLTPMKLRPDAHYEGEKNDCLHWMLPGPVDTWSHFLFHIIRELNHIQKR